MSHIKLTTLLKEIKANNKKIVKETYSRTIKIFSVEDILNSKALGINETKALREFFAFRKSTPVLNENTIGLVDTEMLREGFLDWIKEKGAKFVDFLKGGWDKLKGAWNNFKDFVSGLVAQIKEGMQNVYKSLVDKFNKALSFGASMAANLKDIVSKAQKDAAADLMAKIAKRTGMSPEDSHNKLPLEIATLKETGQYVFGFISNTVVGLGEFAKKAIDGDVEGDPLAESSNLFKDKALVETLISLKESGITHPEDLLKKYPMLQKVVKVVLKIFKYTFGIFGTITKAIGAWVAKNVLGAVNFVSKTIGGPVESGGYAALGALLAELAEIGGHKIHAVHDLVSNTIKFIATILKVACPAIAPFVTIAEHAFEIIGEFFFIYAIITVCLNVLVPVITKFVDYLENNPTVFKVATSINI